MSIFFCVTGQPQENPAVRDSASGKGRIFCGLLPAVSGEYVRYVRHRFWGLLLVWLCFMMDVIVLSIVSLLLYNVTNSRQRRKMTAKIAAILMFCAAGRVYGGKND